MTSPAPSMRPICRRCGGDIRDANRYQREPNGLCVPCMIELANQAGSMLRGGPIVVDAHDESDRRAGRWHEALSLEIELEFIKLTGSAWQETEDQAWRMQQVGPTWAARDWFGWYRQTPVGRKQRKEAERRLRAYRKSIDCGYAKCIACGRQFEVNADRRARRTDRTCSRKCTGRARRRGLKVTIDGVRDYLGAWAERTGIPQATVRKRLKLGWDVRRAFFEPVASFGMKLSSRENAAEQIVAALRNAKGDRRAAAAELGIIPNTLGIWIRRLDLWEACDALASRFGVQIYPAQRRGARKEE